MPRQSPFRLPCGRPGAAGFACEQELGGACVVWNVEGALNDAREYSMAGAADCSGVQRGHLLSPFSE